MNPPTSPLAGQRRLDFRGVRVVEGMGLQSNLLRRHFNARY